VFGSVEHCSGARTCGGSHSAQISRIKGAGAHNRVSVIDILVFLLGGTAEEN
jgi:hypothetical protein